MMHILITWCITEWSLF